MRLQLMSLVLIVATSLPAQAIVISGSFAGAVGRIATPSGDSTEGLGRPAAGSFFVDTDYFGLSETDGSSYARYSFFNVDPSVHSFDISLDQGAGPVVDSLGAQTILLERTSAGDSIYLSDYFPKGFGSSLLFTAPSGTLFNTLSLDSIVGGATIDLSRSRAYTGSYLEDEGNIGTFISLSAANIAVAPAAAVPEPSALSMLLLALGLGGAIRLRRRAEASHQ